MSILKKLVFSIFISSVFISATSEADIVPIAEAKKNDWKKFSSKENGFEVDLPTVPDHVQQKIDIPQTNLAIRYDTYLSEPSDKAVYVVSVWYYPKEIDMSKPEVNLKDGFEGMLTALPGSKVIKMDMGTVDSFKALEFLVKHEEIFFQGKLILVHNTLYQVFTVYKESEEMKKNYERFVSSFKLLDPEKHQNSSKESNSKKMNVMLESF